MTQPTFNTENILSWSKNQFFSFLLLHAAHADLEYSEEEKNIILRHISQETLVKIEAYYNSLTDGQVLQIILQYQSHFLNKSADIEMMLQNLRILFQADGEWSKLERTLYEFLRRLIGDAQDASSMYTQRK